MPSPRPGRLRGDEVGEEARPPEGREREHRPYRAEPDDRARVLEHAECVRPAKGRVKSDRRRGLRERGKTRRRVVVEDLDHALQRRRWLHAGVGCGPSCSPHCKRDDRAVTVHHHLGGLSQATCIVRAEAPHSASGPQGTRRYGPPAPLDAQVPPMARPVITAKGGPVRLTLSPVLRTGRATFPAMYDDRILQRWLRLEAYRMNDGIAAERPALAALHVASRPIGRSRPRVAGTSIAMTRPSFAPSPIGSRRALCDASPADPRLPGRLDGCPGQPALSRTGTCSRPCRPSGRFDAARVSRRQGLDRPGDRVRTRRAEPDRGPGRVRLTGLWFEPPST